MPERKRQHFLAQQHMRRWSNTGKSVSALDKNVPKIIERVSIRNTGAAGSPLRKRNPSGWKLHSENSKGR